MITRIVRWTLGIAFLFFGVLGLFLPILQGILFIIVGLLILAPESPKIQRILDTLKKRYPGPFNAAERFSKKLSRHKERG